ncbi:MAG: hypothetical protein HRU40_21700 [Saprospiraceae bacterium]|nr:hypothetical protein [Saprospiraceae bacterium]
MKKTLPFIFALTLAGCASSPYVYHVEPTQLQSNQTQYNISSVVVNLELGHGAILGDESFATQEQLKKQFETSLIAQMKEKGIYAAKVGNKGFSVDLNINYKRNFNYGGKALNKPHISHSVFVLDGTQQKLASFSQGNYTTDYGTFGDVAVNIEIAAFSWDAEDELRDIELISKIIVEELADLGS